MIALAGPLHLLALVLVVSGMQKLVSPGPAATAMVSAGLALPRRAQTATGIALGAAEIAVGLVALAVPTWWAAALLAATYAGFAAFVVRLRATDATAGCGCFGAASTPPGRAHVAVNLVAAATAAGIAIAGVPDIVEVFDAGVGTAAVYLFLLAIGAGLLLVAPSTFAELEAARRAERPRPFSITPRNAPRSPA